MSSAAAISSGAEVRMRREGAEADGNNIALSPTWLVERIRTLLGGIDLDPCTTPANPVGATRFITPPDDGILARWGRGRVFVNPPYGRTIGAWVDRSLLAASDGCRVVMLVPARTDSRWWHTAMSGGDVLLFRGRLQFGGHDAKATFPSALLGFNVSLEPLSDLGTIVRSIKGAA